MPRRSLSISYLRNLAVACALLPLLLSGCHQFKPKILTHYVYVTAKATFLRDRIAAVSNRTGNVVNGQRLEILEQNRRFYKVRTDKGEIGWIDERAVATEKVSDEFDQLAKDHAKDAPVATGTVRDDVYLHTSPGRDTDRLYRLDEGDKLKLLQRASTLKPQPPGTPSPAAAAAAAAKAAKPGEPVTPPLPPAMEDWWLVHEAGGHTGWMLSRMLDTDAPDSVSRYAEGQRIVGAYVLNTVTDPELQGASQQVPNYVMVTSPYVAGLPYDFNQLRVFYWNLKKHRYEGANRDKNIYGYLPVKTGVDPGSASPGRGIPPTGPAPSYTYTVLAEGAPVPQPDASGQFRPGKGQLVTKVYRLEGNVTRRVLPPGTVPPAEARLEPELTQKEKKAQKRR